MRILVVGAGATGGYFGARLAQAGRDVTFLVRSARAQQLRADGLQIVSPHGDLRLEPNLVTTANLASEYDVILLAVKAFALADAIDDLAPAVGAATMVLPVLNGMRHLDALTGRFGQKPILGGVCVVSTTVDDHGRIVQLHPMQQLVYGERDGGSSTRVDALGAFLQGAGFEARSSPAIIAEMWEKWVMLATLGGITCLMRANVGEIEAVRGGTDLAIALLAECAAVATAAGHAPHDAFVERTRSLLTTPGSPLTSSMYRDLLAERRVEADQVLGDLSARAMHFGVTAPLLAAACTNVQIYDRRTRTVAHAVA